MIPKDLTDLTNITDSIDVNIENLNVEEVKIITECDCDD